MILFPGWHHELLRVLGVFGAAWMLGWWVGNLWASLAIAGWAYLGWHLYQIFRLQRWLIHHKSLSCPHAGGIWQEIARQLDQLQHRNRKRKNKLSGLLKRFQKFTKALPDAFVVLEKNYTIEWFNKVSTTLLGLQVGKDIGLRITDLLREPLFIDYVEQGPARAESIKIISPCNPDIMLRVHLVPYSEKRLLLIARDITRMHTLEQIRRDFVANFSHELRTPLTVISGFLETLTLGEQSCQEQCRRPLALMNQQTQRMQNIVNDLLLLSQLESEDNEQQRSEETVIVMTLVENICAEARALSGELAHHIEVDGDADIALLGNAKELASAFSNIIFNAVHYTPAHGTIWVRWYADHSGAHLEVQDTGEGIAKQHLPRLTERFYRIDSGRSRARGGTGLGLAIVKHVLHRHQATLHIDSRLGIGSTFCCDFPPHLMLSLTVTKNMH